MRAMHMQAAGYPTASSRDDRLEDAGETDRATLLRF